MKVRVASFEQRVDITPAMRPYNNTFSIYPDALFIRTQWMKEHGWAPVGAHLRSDRFFPYFHETPIYRPTNTYKPAPCQNS